jgi:microcystin-dependent protein
MKIIIIIIIIGLLLILQNHALAEAFFTNAELRFASGNGWKPSTPNLSHSATKIIGRFVLEDGTIMDLSPSKNITNYIIPLVGAVMAYVGNIENIPKGWLVCNGDTVKKSDYPLLYRVIGDTWGTPINPTMFVLPNTQDFMIRGLDLQNNGNGITDTGPRYSDPERTTRILNATQKFGSYQNPGAGPHTHPATSSSLTSNGEDHTLNPDTHLTQTHTHTFDRAFANQPILTETPDDSTNSVPWSINPQGLHTSQVTSITQHTHTATMNMSPSSTGGSDGFPKRISFIYLIKATPF